jgi:hypothetical protein
MSSSSNRRYKRKINKLKKEGKLTAQDIINDDMMLTIPTPEDVQEYIDNKSKELRVQTNGLQLQKK